MLREVWMNIGVEKLNMHEGVTIKALLDSGTTGMFIKEWQLGMGSSCKN